MAKLNNQTFRDLTDLSAVETVYPSEALYIDGVGFLEDVIPGFTTISVTGRGALGLSFNDTDVPGMDGTLRTSANLPKRSIVVKYRLQATDAADMIAQQEQLALILLQPSLRYQFNDDKDYWYQGGLSDHDELDAGILDGFGSLTFSNPDPYKYHQLQTTGLNSSFTAKLPTVPTEIRLTATSDTATNFKLTNPKTGLTISLSDAGLTSGQTLVIRPKEQIMTLDGVNEMQWLDYSSDFENFVVSPNDALTVTYKTGTVTVAIDYEGRA